VTVLSIHGPVLVQNARSPKKVPRREDMIYLSLGNRSFSNREMKLRAGETGELVLYAQTPSTLRVNIATQWSLDKREQEMQPK